MPRHSPIALFVFVAAVAGLAIAYAYFQTTQIPRYRQARTVVDQRSEIRLRLLVTHERGPLEEEEYAMSDLDGISHSTYRVLARSGTQITIRERPRETLDAATNVAFLFDEVVQDGIWEVRSQPPRGDTATHYLLEIAQVSGRAHGSRRVAFTDPHYWATTGGHQYHITLDRNKPVPNLLQLSSTALVDRRYEKLVEDMRSFGPPGFRADIARARTRLGIHS